MRHKGIQIVKSGHVEASLLGCTSRVNAARRLCRGLGAAYSFFDSELAPELVESILPDSEAMAAARTLAFLDFFGQLSVKCPVPPQNMHAEVVFEPPFVLVSSQFPVLTKLVGQVQFGAG